MNTRKSKTPIKAPRLPRSLSAAELPRDLPDDGETYSQLEYQQLDLANRILSRPHFEEVVFEQANVAESRFQDLRMEDVRFVGSNLANAVWPDSACARVEFIACRMTGFITVSKNYYNR